MTGAACGDVARLMSLENIAIFTEFWMIHYASQQEGQSIIKEQWELDQDISFLFVLALGLACF
jgi:hypothetical protein